MRVIIGDPELHVIEWCSPWPYPGVRLVLSSAHPEDARPGTSEDGKCRPVPGQPEDGLDLSAGDNWFSTSPSVSTSPDRTGQFEDQGERWQDNRWNVWIIFLAQLFFFGLLGGTWVFVFCFFIIRQRHPLPRPGNLFHLITSCVRVVFGGPTGAGET